MTTPPLPPVNDWRVVATARAGGVAHLWTPGAGPGWLHARCGALPAQFFTTAGLRAARGAFRKCRRCVRFETRRS